MIKNKKEIAFKVLAVYIAFVFIQSLFFKYTNHPETQNIFGTLDAWAAADFGIAGLFTPPGIFNAYVIGTIELIASTFLLIGLFTKHKIATPIGAFIAISVMTGAISFHLFTPLGIEVNNDGGTLFTMACGVWISAAILLFTHKHHIQCPFKKKVEAETE